MAKNRLGAKYFLLLYDFAYIEMNSCFFVFQWNQLHCRCIVSQAHAYRYIFSNIQNEKVSLDNIDQYSCPRLRFYILSVEFKCQKLLLYRQYH